MRILVSGQEMKLLDANTTGRFMVPEQVLMEQAAMVFVEKLLSCEQKPERVLVVCGWGNNGGDGIAIARLLNQRGITAELYCCRHEKDRESALFRLQKEIYRAYHYPEVQELSPKGDFDCIVDAVFGVGLSREIQGETAEVIRCMNGMKGWKVAVDIASGISSDTGALLGTAFAAEDTYTFSFGKLGQYLFPGADYSGRVQVLPMGITRESFLEQKPSVAAFEKEDLSLLPARRAYSHKGSYGKLLVIAGSPGMAGAACFAAEAAYRMGTGLVRVLTAEENAAVLQSCVPEAVLSVYGQTPDGARVLEALAWADAVVMGPGLGTTPQAGSLLEMVLSHGTAPLLVDADGLNLIAEHRGEYGDMQNSRKIIITPHLGEMARLTGRKVSDISANLLDAAREYAARQGVVCVLKDARTVTATPEGMAYINLSGNHGMATAGSGDVLSGVIGGLLAQGVSPERAAALGVYVHGLAGDAAKERIGARSMMARDIINCLICMRETEYGRQKNQPGLC